MDKTILLVEDDTAIAEMVEEALLRRAVDMNRSRSADLLPPMRILANGSRLRMQFPDGWIDAHPLTLEDLESQAAYLREAGFELVLS